MRVLLDECLPRKLAGEISGHDVSTVAREGLKGKADDLLLAAAAAGFDVLVTADRNMAFQQNANTLPVTVIVLHARTNRLIDFIPLVPELLQVLNHLPLQQIVHVPQSSSP